MAKLPDANILGPLDSLASKRPISELDLGAAGRGAAAGAAQFAQGVRDIGSGLQDLGTANADIEVMKANYQRTQANAKFLSDASDLDAKYANDTNYQDMQPRYEAELGKLRDEASTAIDNPVRRQRFATEVSPAFRTQVNKISAHARGLEKDANNGYRIEQGNKLLDNALKAPDEETRTSNIQNYHDLVDDQMKLGYLTRAQGAMQKKEWTENFSEGKIKMLPVADRVRVLGGFEGALIKRESGGNPSLVNQLGYAGLYQFGAPRLAAMGVYKPGDGEDLKNWSSTAKDTAGKWSGTFDIPGRPDVRTLDDFLKSPDAQRAAFQLHSRKMDQEIQANGFDKYIGQKIGDVTITREGLQAMLHIGGVGGQRAALSGKGNPKDANGTSVLDYAKLGQQSDLVRVAELLPEDKRVRMLNDAQKELDRDVVKLAMERSEAHERLIVDASAGIGTLPPRGTIETDAALDEPRRNTLLRQYDSAAGDVAGLQRFMAKFKDPAAGSFNPYDTEERKYADKAFNALGGDTNALSAIVTRTGIVPKAVAAKLRGDLVSSDPQRVANALTLSSNMLNANQNVFVGADGRKELEEAAVGFRQHVDGYGMTAQDAAKNYILQQTPEYQSKVKARLKTEDIDAKIKKELSINDLSGAFDQWKWIPFTDPNVGFDPRARQEMYAQYAELVKDRYQETGDWALAKRQGTDQLKRTWGVSKVNGSSTVMQYPPERAPAYQGIADASEAIAKQAIEAVKAETGVDVERKGIRLQPIAGATAQAYKSGQPVPYMLMWADKQGVVHMLNPGRGFVADPTAMRGSQSEGRQTKLERHRAINELQTEVRGDTRRPFGVP